MRMNPALIREFLEEKASEYNRPEFIASDPVQIPHRFRKKEDIELAAFLTAILAWGQRRTIIKKGGELMQRMDNSPHEFIMNAARPDRIHLEGFCHRTFNSSDTLYFIQSLQNLLLQHGSLGAFFEAKYLDTRDTKETIQYFRRAFFNIPCLPRTYKHIPDVSRGSSAKRLTLFLRWMVRHDDRGVDFGLWRKIPTSALYIPLDVHSGEVARKLGLLRHKQNDWQAVEELTGVLRSFDPEDPVKYDFALFGMGVNEDLPAVTTMRSGFEYALKTHT
jgi:uncharacterized protein (TIGR02757 family)